MIRTKVSVLIPVHDGEGFVGKAIRSILAQGFRDFEVVVLDDGSADGSARVARAFGDQRVRVYRRPEHEGIAATRNHLLMAAKFPVVAFLDADDVALPDRLAKQVAYLERHRETALVSCGFVEIDAQGQNLRQRDLPAEHDALSTRLLHGATIPASTVTARRSAIDAAGGFDLGAGLAAEHDLFLKIAERAKLAALPEPLVKVRLHARAASYARRREMGEAIDEARRGAVLRRHRKALVFAKKIEEPAAATASPEPAEAAAADAGAADAAAAVAALSPIPPGAAEVPQAAAPEAGAALGAGVASDAGAGLDAVAADSGAAVTAEPAAAPLPAADVAMTADVPALASVPAPADVSAQAGAPASSTIPAPAVSPAAADEPQLPFGAVIVEMASAEPPPAETVAPAPVATLVEAVTPAPTATTAVASASAEATAPAADTPATTTIAAAPAAAIAAPAPADAVAAETAPTAGAPEEAVAAVAAAAEAPAAGAASPAAEAPTAAAAERTVAVAVVIPAAGREALAAVKSVLDQTLKDLVLVVVATGSDEGLERGLELVADERVILLDAPGASRARALNLGLLASKSRYLAYLSGSSVYRPEHLARLVQLADAERLGFVYSDVGLSTPGVPGAAVVGRDFDSDLLLKENFVPADAVLHRRDLLQEVGLFNEGLEDGMEWELWVYLTRIAPAKRLALATVERVVGGAKALKLIATSPARVRKHLAEKFSRHAHEARLPLHLPMDELRTDGDAVARAHDRLRQGDWAAAASILVEAAAKPFAALSKLLAPVYPEREVPAELAAPQAGERAPTLWSRPRARPEDTLAPTEPTPAEVQVARHVAPAEAARATEAAPAGPRVPVAARDFRLASMPSSPPSSLPPGSFAPPASFLSPAAGPASFDRTRAERGAEPAARSSHGALADAALEADAEPREHKPPVAWMRTVDGLVGTGRTRHLGASLRTPARTIGRPSMTGTGFGSRRKALASLKETPACPLCGEAEPALSYRMGWYRVLDCAACGLAFSSPRLDPTLAARFFSDRRSEMVPPNVRTADDLAGTTFDRTRELAWVKRHVSGGRIADVGCSWGYALLQARALGFEGFGTELSRTLSRSARERFDLEVFERDFTDLGLDEASLEAVLAVHVIQHFLDPRAFFLAAHHALAPGGVLVGALPNFDSFLRETLGRRWHWLDPECQPFHFRPAALARELEAAGFRAEVWTSEGLYGEAAILEYLKPEEAAEAARTGRASGIGFVAVKPR